MTRFRGISFTMAAVLILGLAGAMPVAATDPATYTASFLCDRGDVPGTFVNQYTQPPLLGDTSCADGLVQQFAAGTTEIQVYARVVVPGGAMLAPFPTVTGIEMIMIANDGSRPTPGQCKSTTSYVACNLTMPANDVTFVFHVATPDTLSAFAAPVDAAPTVNSVQGGRTIPLKFSVLDIDGPVTNLTAADVVVQPALSECVVGTPTDVIETYATSAGLLNLGAGNYMLAYKSSKAWAGMCGTLTVRTTSGGLQSALFAFK